MIAPSLVRCLALIVLLGWVGPSPVVPAAASQPAGDGEPPAPPETVEVLRFDRRGQRVVMCARTDAPDLEHARRELPATEIWLLEAGAFRKLDVPPGACDPVFSPDGEAVAFTAPDGLWVLSDLEQTAPKQLLEAPAPEGETEFGYVAFKRPQWSPNGARLGYVATNGGTAWVEVVEVLDGRLRYRSRPETYAFSWGADSRSLSIGGNTVLVP